MLVYGSYQNTKKSQALLINLLFKKIEYAIGNTSRQITMKGDRYIDYSEKYLTELQVPLFTVNK